MISKLTGRMRSEVRELADWAKSEEGQNTVEYLMMLAVIVGVILVIGKMFKPQISQVFNQIMAMVSGAASSVASGN
ncbi:Flp family type IVb pilin [Elusimicrobiota bacterium]